MPECVYVESARVLRLYRLSYSSSDDLYPAIPCFTLFNRNRNSMVQPLDRPLVIVITPLRPNTAYQVWFGVEDSNRKIAATPSASSLPPPHSHALPATLCLIFPQRGANFCLPPGRFLTSNCRHLRMYAFSGPRGHSNRCASN